jgi:hypothetical protein
MKRRFYWWIATAALIGVFVPIAILLLQEAVGYSASASQTNFAIHRVMRIVWPSSVWLMATEGIEGTGRDCLFVSLSVIANMLLYGGLGGIVYGIKGLVTRTTGR